MPPRGGKQELLQTALDSDFRGLGSSGNSLFLAARGRKWRRLGVARGRVGRRVGPGPGDRPTDSPHRPSRHPPRRESASHAPTRPSEWARRAGVRRASRSPLCRPESPFGDRRVGATKSPLDPEPPRLGHARGPTRPLFRATRPLVWPTRRVLRADSGAGVAEWPRDVASRDADSAPGRRLSARPPGRFIRGRRRVCYGLWNTPRTDIYV